MINEQRVKHFKAFIYVCIIALLLLPVFLTIICVRMLFAIGGVEHAVQAVATRVDQAVDSLETVVDNAVLGTSEPVSKQSASYPDTPRPESAAPSVESHQPPLSAGPESSAVAHPDIAASLSASSEPAASVSSSAAQPVPLPAAPTGRADAENWLPPVTGG